MNDFHSSVTADRKRSCKRWGAVHVVFGFLLQPLKRSSPKVLKLNTNIVHSVFVVSRCRFSFVPALVFTPLFVQGGCLLFYFFCFFSMPSFTFTHGSWSHQFLQTREVLQHPPDAFVWCLTWVIITRSPRG